MATILNVAAPLSELIDEAKKSRALTYVNPDIISSHFKEVGVRGKLRLEDPKLSGWFSSKKVVATLCDAGFEPATMCEALSYVLDPKGWDRKTPVAILGSVWRHSYLSNFGSVGVITAVGGRRILDLADVDANWYLNPKWPHRYSFLAVPRVSIQANIAEGI